MQRFKRSEGVAQVAPYSIQCRDCDASETVENTRGGNMPHDVVAKKFAQKGWEVGSKPGKDRCPACQTRRRKMRYTVDKNLRVDVHQRPILTIVKEPTVPTPETPIAELSRDVRRRIIGRLDEVYATDGSGYKQGWSDRKVAGALGVVEAWVADLRVENFGDLPVSAIDKGFVDEAKAILEQIQGVRAEADAMRHRAAELLAEAREIGKQIGALDKRLEDLLLQEMVLAEQIAKVA